MVQPSTSTVRYGAGSLYICTAGAQVEPTSVSSALDPTWVALGYTEAGSTFTSTPAVTALEVAEDYHVIKNIVTGIAEKLSFALAEMTYANVVAAFNGGVATVNGTNTTFQPPVLGSEVRVAFLWQSLDTLGGFPLERWVYRQCFQAGAVAIARTKTAKTMIPVDFTLEKPVSAQPWQAWFAGALASA